MQSEISPTDRPKNGSSEPPAASASPEPRRPELCTSEDWWAVWIGGTILTIAFLAVFLARPSDLNERLEQVEQQARIVDRARPPRTEREDDSGQRAAEYRVQAKRLSELQADLAPNPLKPWLAKIQSWKDNPLDAFSSKPGAGADLAPELFIVFCTSLILFGGALKVMGKPFLQFAAGFVFVFALATVGFVLANQDVINTYNLEYPLWALLVGLVVSNTIGTPAFVRPAVNTEFYIKTGLVLLGAKILVNRLLALGVPGICVAWLVTPVVLIATYLFGQKVLRMGSKTLNITISADMSVCGVSAAIATAAACRAKKEELSLAIGLSLGFTVVMMTVMPAFIKAVGMSEVLGGAWMGGTIDATGAVAAAGAFLGGAAEDVAVTVKMIQNILIGAIAFGVAVYWVVRVEPDGSDIKPNAWEIWHRFPKFVIGFLAASVAFSIVSGTLDAGRYQVDSMIKGTTDVLRGWFFCLAFASIGLETNFRELAQHMKGGKPLILYVCGQCLNLTLTLLMAWLMFEVVFREAVYRLVE